MSRGSLRVYLGAAPGVGKTFAMLNEGRRRAARGTDVVVAYVETHGRPNTAAQLEGLEVVPRRVVEHRGLPIEELDLDAVLARRPAVALVDELAHTNAPGSRHEKRWEDVEELLDAGIDVITTVNVQHLASLNDVVERITGVVQRETVPDEVVRAADQVELVDMAPEALRRRLAHGNVYAPEKVDAALGNYFRVGNLGALRELALLWVADRVDDALRQYRVTHGIDDAWETRERVAVAVTGAPSGDQLIRRAARMAARMRGDLVGLHVAPADGLAAGPAERLEAHRRLLADLGGSYVEVVGADVATTLVDLARAEQATQLVLGATGRSRPSELLRGSVVHDVLRRAGRSMDVHVIGAGDPPEPDRRPRPRGRRAPLVSARRRRAGWLLALGGPPLLTALLAGLRDDLGLPSQLLLFLLVVVAAAATGGRGPAVASALAGFGLANWFFTPPYYTVTVGDLENLLALVTFLAVGTTVSLLVVQASTRAGESARARADAEALARASLELLAVEDPIGALLRRVEGAFGLDGVALFRRAGEGWTQEAGAGAAPPVAVDDGDAVEVADDLRLVVRGLAPTSEDRRLLVALGAQVAAAADRVRLQRAAADAAVAAEADELRVALLRAVSHDLRTPLASIKASVTSLLQDDVRWAEADVAEFLATIDEESDRLDRLVANLLDMGRLQSGAVRCRLRSVGLEEVAPAALEGLGVPAEAVAVDLDPTLPGVLADPALLERVLANLVGNAVAADPVGPVRLEAGRAGGAVHVRVVDRGPGIPPADRARVFEPFQRLGDGSRGGVGLGLAVARGFVDAMGGELAIEDTPGGGVTMVVSLPAADEGAS